MEEGEYKNNWYFQSAEHVKLKRIIVFKKNVRFSPSNVIPPTK
jgi:hypothetical protein